MKIHTLRQIPKFRRKAQFPQIFGENSPKTLRKLLFTQNFHTRKLGDISVFTLWH